MLLQAPGIFSRGLFFFCPDMLYGQKGRGGGGITGKSVYVCVCKKEAVAVRFG
jgi:hypothetical protein